MCPPCLCISGWRRASLQRPSLHPLPSPPQNHAHSHTQPPSHTLQAPQQNFVGLALDLCYHPLDDPGLAAPVLQDLAAALQEAAEAAGGRLRGVADSGGGFQLPPAFGPRHRAVQYVQLMALLQEQAG